MEQILFTLKSITAAVKAFGELGKYFNKMALRLTGAFAPMLLKQTDKDGKYFLVRGKTRKHLKRLRSQFKRGLL